jgi:hypothetical protein
MSNFIPLRRAPRSKEERQQLLAEEVAKEERLANMGVSHLKNAVVDYLVSFKGYDKSDIEFEKEFQINHGSSSFTIKADLIVKLEDRAVLLVKCAMSTPESWERYAVACCRVSCSDVIPFCLVTDGEIAHMIDAQTGKTIADKFEKLPTKSEALHMIKQITFAPLPCDKAEKEKRILLAFEGISCNAELDKGKF